MHHNFGNANCPEQESPSEDLHTLPFRVAPGVVSALGLARRSLDFFQQLELLFMG